MINVSTITRAQLANLFDHTLLKADAKASDFETLCKESRENGFKMVAINSAPVALCKKLLQGCTVHVGAAISFPLGQTTTETKLFETQNAIENGADEIDYVVNLADVKNGNWTLVEKEMGAMTKLCRKHEVLVKVIFENCYLSASEIEHLARIARMVQPDFIKTSTGFGPTGATAEDVARMKQTVGEDVKVKAAGGIRSWACCKAMLQAGAERIGTSSSFKILEEFDQSQR